MQQEPQPSGELTQLALRLRAVSRDDGSIDAAQVRVIGLDEIREAAGARWPHLRERVRSGSMEILSRHTATDDVIVPAGDGFLIILAEGAPGHNQDRCRKMREALLSYYLGEEALEGLRPEVTSRSLSAEGFADLITSGMHTQPVHAPAGVKSAEIDIAQAPLHAARDRRIVGNWFSPVRHERGTRRLAYNSDFILDGRHRSEDFLDLDVAILKRAVAEVINPSSPDPQHRLPVGFTVHASTMQSRRSREAYFGALSSIPPDARRGLIVTIAEIEKGTPLLSIAEWSCGLRAIVARVCLDFHYTDHAIASIGGTGAWAAGFHLPIYSGAQLGPRAARTLDQLRFWTKSIHGQGMRLAVNGFRESDFLRQAAIAGVDVATSDVLWPFLIDRDGADVPSVVASGS